MFIIETTCITTDKISVRIMFSPESEIDEDFLIWFCCCFRYCVKKKFKSPKNFSMMKLQMSFFVVYLVVALTTSDLDCQINV